MNPDGTERTPETCTIAAQPFNWQGRLFLLLILVAGIVAYHSSFSGAFMLDDHHWITDSPAIRRFPPARDYLISNPRPVLLLSLCMNYWLGKTTVWSYHAFNLAVHLLAALLLYGVVRRTLLVGKLRERFGRRAAPLACAAALLFVVHPLQIQSVTYVVQRCESLMGMFSLLTLYCVIRSVDSPRRAWWGFGAFVSLMFAIASKEVAVVVPLLIMFYDRIFLTHSFRHMVRSRWMLHVALASIWLIPAYIWLQAVPVNAGFGYQGITPLDYARTQAGVVLYYLRLSFWPHSLCFDYSDWPRTSTWSAFALPGLGIGLLLLVTVWALVRKPGLGFLGLCFFLILAPSSSIMPIADVAFEQRMYLSLAALIVLVVLAGDAVLVWLFNRLAAPDQLRQGVMAVLVLGVAVPLAAVTVNRNHDYVSEAAIWRDVTVKRPANVRAHVTLGTSLWRAKQIDAAREQFVEAARLEPRSLFAQNGMGLCLMDRCKYAEALEHFKKVIEACAIVPFGHTNQGLAQMGLGHPAEAAESFREAVELAPQVAGYHFNLALALSEQGLSEKAQEEYQAGLRLIPDWPMSVRSQAWAVAMQAEPDPAGLAHVLMLARQACEATEAQQPDILGTLAAVYAQAGQFDKASATAHQALDIATENDRPALARQIRHQLSFYEQGRPYHEETN